MRKEYKMTDEQLNKILDASNPVTYMVFGGMEPSSPQENANMAWAALGNELGFKPFTVQSVSGKDSAYFTAEEKEEAHELS